MDEISSFGVGDLTFDAPSEQRSGKAYLKAILDQHLGSCRHRAVAFKARMQEEHSDVPTRVMGSDCHSWAEIYLNSFWQRCEFGGYKATLDIKDTLPAVVQLEEKQHLGVGIESKSERESQSNLECKDESKHEEKHAPALDNKYLKILRTWEVNPAENKPIDPVAYRKEWLKPDAKNRKRWIKLGSNEAVDAMAISLQRHCKSTQRPVFYIDSPADVFCSKRFLEQKGNWGRLHKGPGGALHDFLKANYSKDNPPVIVINHRNFTRKQIIGLHGWLDPERTADGTPIPSDALIVVVSNVNAPEAYTDTDLASRFDMKDEQLTPRESLPEFVPPLPIRDKTANRDKTVEKNNPVINLYHGSDWKSQLLGRWAMTEQGLYFEEGKLMAALAQGLPIEIQNGLWEDPEFNAFWHQACWVGEVRHQGKVFKTEGLSVLKSDGYEWPRLQQKMSITLKNSVYDVSEDILLNPSQLSQFLGSYTYQAELKTLIKTDGHLKQAATHKQKFLSVYLTRAINEDAWARLLTACEDAGVSLSVKLSPGVILPPVLCNVLKDNAGSRPIISHLESKTDDYRQIIQSNDPYAAIAQIKADEPSSSWIVIDVSELNTSDLLIKTSPEKSPNDEEEESEEKEEKQSPLRFIQSEMALLSALKENKNIILTGSISDALADGLAPILLQRKNSNPQAALGKLMVVAKDTQALQYVESPPRPREYFAQRAMTEPDRAKFYKLTFDKKDLGEWNGQTLKNTLKKTNDFFASRNQSIQKVLFDPQHPSPCVYISGLSGVGKSTFIDEELQKPYKLFKGETDMAEWAAFHHEDPKSKEPIYLFIDEANLSPRQWTELEGLYSNQPPTIVVEGKLCTLSPQHKIIFAGNPLSYGNERSLALFLIRHAPVIEFKPLPYCVIFEKTLRPVFENTHISAIEQESLSKHFLSVYAFLCEQSKTDVLISPRELQMMALLTVSYCKQMQKEGIAVDRDRVARHYAYKLAESLVPAEKRALFVASFGEKQPVIKPLPLPIEAINKNPHFRATHSRLDLLHSLHELLILREGRQQASNEKQQFGGLGGILLQGESSVGKTTMVTAVLCAHEFEEEHDYQKPSRKAKPFYRIDANRSIEEREKLAVKACYEGAVIMVDEFNTASSMERLLNDLMMGKIPKKYQKPDEKIKPGFLVIGTQNSPTTMTARSLLNTSQARRWQLKEVPGYPPEELLEIILGNRDYSDEKEKIEEFRLVVEAFNTNVAVAKKEHKSPAPTLREVFRITDAIQELTLKKAQAITQQETVKQVELLEPTQKQIYKSQPQSKPKAKHSNSYFVLRLLEVVALAGAVALMVTAFAASLGMAALIAGAALGSAVLLIELGLFVNNCVKKNPSTALDQEMDMGLPWI